MHIDESLGAYFKPETQSSGRKLVAQEKVSLGSGGDTAIQAFIRVAPVLKVNLTTESIDSPVITAECNCPASKKGQLCKHIWATLICVEEKYPDFLSGKSNIEKAQAASDPRAAAREEAAEAARQSASERRKEYYQQQKARAKEYQADRKAKMKSGRARGGENAEVARPASQSPYPADVDAALAYFNENGFPMPEGPSESIVNEAKRKLSRVFHPDKGGSHEESIELNRHSDRIRRYLREG